ncbi:MAG: disulfide bond formation protein B [Solirubrobacteraceae bacterium]|nr:disulfide bond formation protein B [Solirubrobacteraceae bacterium]
MSRSDWTDLVSTLLAAGAVVLQVTLGALLVLALLSLAWRPARDFLADMRDLLGTRAIWLAWALALTATLGSLFFSEVSHFIPCRLCWYQRIAMYPLAVILLVAALRRSSREALLYAIAFPLVGGAVSIWHLYIEANPGAESASCKIGAPCSTKWIDEFGYVTIPMLALSAFATIAVLLVAAWGTRDDGTADRDEREPEVLAT